MNPLPKPFIQNGSDYFVICNSHKSYFHQILPVKAQSQVATSFNIHFIEHMTAHLILDLLQIIVIDLQFVTATNLAFTKSFQLKHMSFIHFIEPMTLQFALGRSIQLL